jgi:hypothetical protein
MQTIDQRYRRVLSLGIRAFKRALSEDDEKVYLWTATIAHELFESYLMLEAGIYFGLNKPATLDMFDDFFFALRDRELTDRIEYVDHSNLSAELVSDFPNFAARLERRMRGERFETPGLGLRIPKMLAQRFARIMLLQLSMVEQPSIRVYTAAIRYLSVTQWDRLMEARSSPEATARAGDMIEITPEGVYHGFFSLIGKIYAINDDGNDPDLAAAREGSDDLARLLEYARNTIDWRLNFRSHESSRRFDRIRERMVDASTEGLSAYEKIRLRDQLDDVLDHVLGLTPV